MDYPLLLIDQRGKKYLVEGGQTLHTDLGIYHIPTDKVLPTTVSSHMGKPGLLLRPSVRDYVECMERRTSIPAEKDIGLVIAHTGTAAGSRVLDAGTGSGASALYFSAIVGDKGVVYSYEVRDDLFVIARSNIEGFGCTNVRLFNADVREAPAEFSADLVFLDLQSPSDYLQHVTGLLRPGGFVAAFCPFVEDASRSLQALKELGMMELKVLSVTANKIQVLPQGTRPKTTQNVHTGYMVFGRKVIASD